MAIVNINTGAMVDDLGLIVNVQSPRPPFQAGVGIHAKTYVEGTDFNSADTVNIRVKNCPSLRFVSIMNAETGAVVTHTITAYAAGFGFNIAITAPNADIQVLIIFDI